jgi:Spy/CpxP family protein refolding chaperone
MMAGCLFATGQSKRDVGYQHNGNMTDAHLNWLDQQLNLTEDQMAKLRPIRICARLDLRRLSALPDVREQFRKPEAR